MRWVLYRILRLFYRYVEGIDPFVVFGTVFFLQKIVGFNRLVPWPMHFTSRVIAARNVRLGRRSFPGLSSHCYIQAKNGIQIGDNFRMGPGVGLISANHSLIDYDKWEKTEPIVIGSNVWLGMNVVVMPGVKIGDNVVVAANSVVAADIPSNKLYGGVPAKYIRENDGYAGSHNAQ